jgi:hypothetical protein
MVLNVQVKQVFIKRYDEINKNIFGSLEYPVTAVSGGTETNRNADSWRRYMQIVNIQHNRRTKPEAAGMKSGFMEKYYQIPLLVRKGATAPADAKLSRRQGARVVEFLPKTLMPRLDYRKAQSPPEEGGKTEKLSASRRPLQMELKTVGTEGTGDRAARVDINKIINRVYLEIEKKLKSERQRRGL